VVEAPLEVAPFNAGQLSVSAIALSRNVQPISPEAAQEETGAGKYPLISAVTESPSRAPMFYRRPARPKPTSRSTSRSPTAPETSS